MNRSLCIMATILAGIGALSNLAQDTPKKNEPSLGSLPDGSKQLERAPSKDSKPVVFMHAEHPLVSQSREERKLIAALESVGIAISRSDGPNAEADVVGVSLHVLPDEPFENVKQVIEGLHKLGAWIQLSLSGEDFNSAFVTGFANTPYEKVARLIEFLSNQNVKFRLKVHSPVNAVSPSAGASDAPTTTREPKTTQATIEIRAFHLGYARAGSVVELLKQLFGSPSTAIGADERTNSILIRGEPEFLVQIEAIVKKLDQPTDGVPDKGASDNVPLKPQKKSQFQNSGSDLRDHKVDSYGGLRGFSFGTMTATATATELKRQYEAEEQKVAQKAQQLRDLLAKGSAQESRIAQLRTELRSAVAAAFSARQQLHQVELAEFQSRASQIQKAIDQRSSIRDQIIDRRVEDLLNPNLRWDSDSSSGPSGAQGPEGLQGLKKLPAPSGSVGVGELPRERTSASPKTAVSDASIPLTDAVRAFNAKYASHPVGKDQPPLTDNEVVASIRWAAQARNGRTLSDENFRTFETVAESRTLPENVRFDVVTNSDEPDKSKLLMWSIRITENRLDGTFSTHVLREQYIRWQPAEGTTTTQPPTVDGQIVTVGAKDLLEISNGTDDGIKPGQTLHVFRGSSYLGRVLVRETLPHRAVVEIVPESRKGIIKAGDRVATAPVNSDSVDQNGRPLAAAIHGFNLQHRSHLIGKEQPPLTEEEVVAAIRHWRTKRNEVDVTNAEFDAFQAIADTRVVPENVEFEVLTSFQSNDTFEFDAWSVRLVTPRTSKAGWTYAYTIRDRWIRSRRLDEGEISWGPRGANGFQAGIMFDPTNEQYAIGQQVLPRFFYRNCGSQQQSVAFPRLMTHSYYDALRAVDDAGRDIAIDQDPGPGGPVGWIQMPFGPKSHHEIAGLPIVLGDVPREAAIETVIRAQPGQSCRVRFTVPNYGEPKSDPLQTGEIQFTIAR